MTLRIEFHNSGIHTHFLENVEILFIYLFICYFTHSAKIYISQSCQIDVLMNMLSGEG